MIKAGPLYGLSRARKYSLQFAFRYFLFGIPWALAAAVLARTFSRSEGPSVLVLEAFFMMLIVHLYSLIVVLPAALMANFVAIRIFRRRSWRREPWRAWVAGFISAPLAWAGSYGLMMLQGWLPEILQRAGEDGRVLYFLGSVVLCSNLGIFAAWSLPGRKRAGGGP